LKPLMVDLYAGLGGWAEGGLAEGYDVIGFDIERHVYGEHRYPAQLVVQDVLTLHGSQFTSADLIVASPPCQFFSYCAMPWSRAKQLAADVRADPARMEKELALFNACFRIQREACEAAGRHIPLIVENVRGAQPWVGRARWNFGSFYLFGDVPALMPPIFRGSARLKTGRGEQWNVNRENFTGTRPWSGDDGHRKLPGFRFDGSGRSFQSASVEGVKQGGSGRAWFAELTTARRKEATVIKNEGVKAVRDGEGYGGNFGWDGSPMRRGNSKSSSRKFASAMIAKIPLPLSRHIAATFKPRAEAA
jgi:C-5 cytosine-specific DNA methylase